MRPLLANANEGYMPNSHRIRRNNLGEWAARSKVKPEVGVASWPGLGGHSVPVLVFLTQLISGVCRCDYGIVSAAPEGNSNSIC